MTNDQTPKTGKANSFPRRSLVVGAASAGAVLSGATLLGVASAQEKDNEKKDEKGNEPAGAKALENRDRQAVLQAGMTEAEADCWAKVAEAAGMFFQLPELHPTDNAEVATAIHVIQNKLLGRPTYRSYLAFHKAHAPKQKEGKAEQ